MTDVKGQVAGKPDTQAAPDQKEGQAAAGAGAGSAAGSSDGRGGRGGLKGLIAKIRGRLTRRKLTYLLAGAAVAAALIAAVSVMLSGAAAYIKYSRVGALVTSLRALEDGDRNKAISVLMKAALKGSTEAAQYLSWIYCRIGNFEKALNYARQATSNGENYSVYEIFGDLALLGYGQATGSGPAMYYFTEHLRALPEETHQSRLREMLEYGIHLSQTRSDYIRLIQAGAKEYSPLAILLQGDVEFLGEAKSLSPTSAVRSWRKAEREGVPEATTRRAGVLWNGYGTPRDFDGAIALYEEANRRGDPLAGYFLGMIKLRTGGDGNYEEAMRLWRSAGRRGNPQAMTAVALMQLWQNRHDEEIVEYAADLLRDAHELGDSCASLFYVLMLYSGEGTERNREEAVSILYDLKSREPPRDKLTTGQEIPGGGRPSAVEGMLNYMAYKTDESLTPLFDQMLELVVSEYMGDLHFKVGDPSCEVYHLNLNSLNYFVPSYRDEEITAEQKQKIGRNYIDRITSPAAVRIQGLPLVFPQMTEVLIYSEPSTGAQRYVAQSIINISPEIPPLPEEYSSYKFDWQLIHECFD